MLVSRASSGSRAQAGSPTIAARWTIAPAPWTALRAGLVVADVADADVGPALLERFRDLVLAEQQGVQDPHVAARVEQRRGDFGADVAGPAGDQREVAQLRALAGAAGCSPT